MDFWIKPGILVGTTKDHRHSLMDFAHQLIGGRGQDGKRPTFIRRARVPGVPDSRYAHNGFVAKMDFERTLSLALRLPFEKAAQRDDGALAKHQISIKPG